MDSGIKYTHQMWAAMVPAAVDSIYTRLYDTGRKLKDYDFIITGHMGFVGKGDMGFVGKGDMGFVGKRRYGLCGEKAIWALWGKAIWALWGKGGGRPAAEARHSLGRSVQRLRHHALRRRSRDRVVRKDVFRSL